MSSQSLLPENLIPNALTSETLTPWLMQCPALCLFLDIDGTLAPFTLTPTDSKIPDHTLTLIKKLQYLGVPVAIITGRSLVEARQMLDPLNLPIGATHGLEIAVNTNQNPIVARFIHVELPLIIEQIEQQCQTLQLTQCLVEKKPYSVALHYRRQPELAEIAEKIMQEVASNFPNWQLNAGKFVWEIMPNGVDKGQAVTAILAHFNQSLKRELYPIFIGDDVSDEAGFMAVQSAGGVGIKVGETTTTNARFFVKNINEVSQILQSILGFYQTYQTSTYQTPNSHTPNSQNEPIL